MKMITRFAGFAVALLLAGAAFAAGSPTVGKDSVPVEKTFGKSDAAAVDSLTLTNTHYDLAFVAEWQGCIASSPAGVTAASDTLALPRGYHDQRNFTGAASCPAREPERVARISPRFASLEMPRSPRTSPAPNALANSNAAQRERVAEHWRL